MAISKFVRDYSLGLTLFALFIISWILHGVYEWQRFAADQENHGRPVSASEFTPEFLASTLENWQSEFLQLFTMVVLTSFLVHKGSPESRDSQLKTEAALDRIETKLNGLSRPVRGRSGRR